MPQNFMKKGISSIPVENSGRVVGIITDRDFVKKETIDYHPEKVGDIMSKDLITIGPYEKLMKAVRLMGKHKIRHLVVKDGQKTLGIVSLRDVLKIEPEAIYGYIAQKSLKMMD